MQLPNNYSVRFIQYRELAFGWTLNCILVAGVILELAILLLTNCGFELASTSPLVLKTHRTTESARHLDSHLNCTLILL